MHGQPISMGKTFKTVPWSCAYFTVLVLTFSTKKESGGGQGEAGENPL